MDDDRKKSYQDWFKARIEEWEERLEELAARAGRAQADLRSRLWSDESGLRENLEEARSRLRELREASDEGWEEVKMGAERIWVDVQAAWERAGQSESANQSEPIKADTPAGKTPSGVGDGAPE